jgi:hypothetical protein
VLKTLLSVLNIDEPHKDGTKKEKVKHVVHSYKTDLNMYEYNASLNSTHP